MKQYFITNDNKYVNLRETTSIAFEDNNRYKIIFNMNYGISLKNNTNKIISDYVYSVYNTYEEFEENLLYLMNLVDEYQWIKCKDPRLVNPDHISFVTTDPRKNRIIINIASSVSFNGDLKNKTSDFVYINCDDQDEYNEKLTYIQDALDNLVL